MRCTYCSKRINYFNAANEHFIPKCLGGKGKRDNNLLKSCEKCNQIKSLHPFWSIKSVREYINIKNKKYNYTYYRFIKNKLKQVINNKEKRKLLCRVFDMEVENKAI